MAFLSAPVPWQALVAAYAEELESSIKVAHPDLSDVVVGVRGREVLAVAAAGASDLESVAWRIACELAPSWPGFLIEAEVGLRVVGGGVALSVEASAMVPSPSVQGQVAWLEQATISMV